MNNKESYKSFLLYWLVGILLMLLFWGGMLRKSFNADTVYFIVEGDGGFYNWLQDARYVSALISLLLKQVGLTTATNLSVTMALAFIVCAATIAIIALIFEEWFRDSTIAFLGLLCGVSLAFCSGLFAENWMFTETSFSFALTYFFVSLACYNLKIKKYFCMVLFLLLGICTYQVAVPFFIILTLFYLYYKNEKILTIRIFAESFGLSVLAVFLGFLNLMSIRLMDHLGIVDLKKNVGNIDILENLRAAVMHCGRLYKDSDGLLPNLWLPLLFAIFVMGSISYMCIREHNTNKLIYNWLLFLVCHLVLYMLPMLTKGFSFPCRMSFVFFLIHGMFFLNALDTMNQNVLMLYAGIGYFCIQLLFCNFIVTNRFISNTLDEVYAHMIVNYIEKYEEDTGNRIQYLAVCTDSYAPNSYEEVTYKSHEINERSLRIVPGSLLEYITGRTFERKEMPDSVYHEHFEGKNWDYFDAEQQVVFENDTVYLCIF